MPTQRECVTAVSTVEDGMNEARRMTFHFGHRMMLFAFLGDESLTKRQRAVGAALILMASGKHGFALPYKPVDWGKVSSLSGYAANGAQEALAELISAGWFEEKFRLSDGAFTWRVNKERRQAAKALALERYESRNSREVDTETAAAA